jgi:hypothetical protein
MSTKNQSKFEDVSYAPTAYAAPFAKEKTTANAQGEPFYYTSKETAARYPEVERVEREKAELANLSNQLISEAGYTFGQAREMAKKLLSNQKEANAIKIQEQMLAADDARLQLENHRKKLTADSRLNSFARQLNQVDVNDLKSFNEKLEMVQLGNMDIISDNNLGNVAQELIREKINAHTLVGNIAETQVRKFGLPGVTPDVLDENGRLNPQRALISAQKYQAQEFTRKLEEDKKRAEVAEKTRIAVYDAALKSKEDARKRDPMYQQQLEILKLTEKQKLEDTLAREYNNAIIASGISPENAKYIGKEISEGDENGRPTEKGKGTRYIYKDNKGRPFSLPKESVDYIRNKSMQHRALLDNAEKILSQNAQEGGQTQAPQATTEQAAPRQAVPQFQEGQRIRQGNAIYEIQNGQPVQVQ